MCVHLPSGYPCRKHATSIGRTRMHAVACNRSFARPSSTPSSSTAGTYTCLKPMQGGFIVAADLVRAINPVPDGLEVEFVQASSYGAGTETSGKARCKRFCIQHHVRHKNVPPRMETAPFPAYDALHTSMRNLPSFSKCPTKQRPSIANVDDLCDSGLTLSEVAKAVAAAGAESTKTLVLLDKKERRKVDITPDYHGFDVSSLHCIIVLSSQLSLAHVLAIVWTDATHRCIAVSQQVGDRQRHGHGTNIPVVAVHRGHEQGGAVPLLGKYQEMIVPFAAAALTSLSGYIMNAR
eukprot:365747-Chlamydomonas_euryale.AAC.24